MSGLRATITKSTSFLTARLQCTSSVVGLIMLRDYASRMP
jgi:hypothetical protein